MKFPELDLEDLWQAVRLHYARQNSGALTRCQWFLYSTLHRLTRALLIAGVEGATRRTLT
jgi:hypothetical protein